MLKLNNLLKDNIGLVISNRDGSIILNNFKNPKDGQTLYIIESKTFARIVPFSENKVNCQLFTLSFNIKQGDHVIATTKLTAGPSFSKLSKEGIGNVINIYI